MPQVVPKDADFVSDDDYDVPYDEALEEDMDEV